MTDAQITTIVTGGVTIAGMFFGFLTLWLKLKYGVQKTAETAANAATQAVTTARNRSEVLEKKLDANTATTNAVNEKTDTIVEQTDGAMAEMHDKVDTIAERVSKLEEYNHESVDKLADTLTAIHLKVAALYAANKIKTDVTELPNTEDVK